jgi:hypothetical protein
MAELTRRYIVMPMSTEGPFDPADPDAPFVLKPWKDPPELAQDITTWIAAIRSGPTVRGSVGARNESHLASRRPRTRPKAKPKAKAAPKVRPSKKAKRKARKKR